MALFLLLSTPPAPHSKDIWSSSAPTWDRSPDLKNKVTVANSKPSWERRQWLRGSPGHPGSSHGPVKGGQRRGEAREGYGLTLGKAGTDSRGGEDSFKTTFFFFFFSISNLLGSMEARALLWVGSRVMGWGLEKVRSCFHQLRPAGKERTALK